MDADDLLALVAERTNILDALTDGPLPPRDVVERVETSRSTFNRAVRELDDAGLVDRAGGDCSLTLTGQLMLDRYQTVRQEVEGIAAARDALAPLCRDASIDPGVFVHADISRSDESTPYRPEERLHEVVREATGYHCLLPALDDPRHIRLLYEHVVTDDLPATIVVPRELADSLDSRFPRRLAGMAESDEFELLAGDVPSFGLVVTEDDDETTVVLVVFGDAGVHAVVVAEAGRADEWAATLFERYQARATPVTDEFRQHADGGVLQGEPLGAEPGLLVDLEREGFVRLSRRFFAEQRVADPTTAWRADLDIAEVHTGYAVERPVEGETLSERLLTRLRDGEDCALVGPPGSGKSTTCKRVASEWYAADRGPVLYRESDRGAPFESVDELVAAARESAGHTLVVVEDGVRPEAAAVFEAQRRLAADKDEAVSILVDARQTEWQDPPGDVDRSAVTVETVPPLVDGDYERFVEHFEATADTEVDVPVERLREEVESAATGAGADEDAEGVAPGSLLLLTHRLAAYDEPVATDGPTTLETDAGDVLDTVEERGESAVDVAVAANLLNAAGIPFGPDVLRTVATSTGNVGEDTVGTELSAIDGRVVFGVMEGTYRTVHDRWSVAFLEQLLDRQGEADARRQVSRVLTRLLALADDDVSGDRRETPSPGEGGTGPTEWADRTVEALFRLARERPKLAALFGDADGPTVELPSACDAVSTEDCRLWLGQAFHSAGDYDRAEAVFDALPDDEFGPERHLGLSRAARCRGALESARDHAKTCLSRAEGRDDVTAARARRQLGEVAYREGAFDRAHELFDAAISVFRDAEERRLTAEILATLGNVEQRRANYDRAEQYLRQSRDTAREIGDRAQEAHCLNGLGGVALSRSEYDRAEQNYRECLDISRDTGDRYREAMALSNLGIVARKREAFEQSERYHSESLEIRREIGDTSGIISCLRGLAVAADRAGDYEQAEAYYQEALALAREIGDRHAEATALLNIGDTAHHRGEHDRARERLKQARDTMQAVEDPVGAAVALAYLGELARETGDTELARQQLQTAADRFAELGVPDRQLDALETLVEVERDAGNHDRARTYCRRAVDAAEAADADLADRREAFEARLTAVGDPSGESVEAKTERSTDD